MNPYDFAIKITKEAGERLKNVNRDSLRVTHKGGDVRDVVTNIDIEINKFITEEIEKQFPDHSIYSEEAGSKISKGEYMWAIDPIDGSSNFSRDIPHFAVCLALLHKGVPILGAVYNPITNELFSFEEGRGVFLNSKPISVSKVTEPNEAQGILIIGHHPELWDWGTATHRSFLEHLKRLKALGSSSLDLCFLAAGRTDVVVYGTLTTKDIAGAIGILRAVGGEIYTAEGAPVELSSQPQTIIATANKKLFKRILPLVHTDLLSPKSSA